VQVSLVQVSLVQVSSVQILVGFSFCQFSCVIVSGYALFAVGLQALGLRRGDVWWLNGMARRHCEMHFHPLPQPLSREREREAL
jgi:hypothetical protein